LVFDTTGGICFASFIFPVSTASIITGGGHFYGFNNACWKRAYPCLIPQLMVITAYCRFFIF